MIWVVHPGSGSLPIPDPGSRGQKGTGSRIRICNTASNEAFCIYLQHESPYYNTEGGTRIEAPDWFHIGLFLFRYRTDLKAELYRIKLLLTHI
jgi:hypothetical protein